ncbi:diguanylate cyclase [Pigmentiphaga sp.]|uniref:GGDEF domain-containing protein n=1 Tax=Pigmentiphaga sp. TaxID=1977564 RepID=UPI00128E3341|nr:diguanylate cyclase [Pigmentiphaga sp.]MPS26671.1 GGDEF domain-containing protein [Alcaligenaceae bacterium SAGV5]MPS53697.1 GGDEF domain-containing protein [Alcaligenaceae bacterium SAGV3]MPT59232.1 GGDEF domain-containing protein [Alcaligenaceae bacterium]
MLDPISVIFVTIFSAIMSTAVLGSLLPTAIPGVRRWFTASALAIVALALFLLQSVGPRWLTILVSNQLLAVAMLLILQGCRQFVGLRPVRYAEYGVLLALLAGMAYWTYAVPDVNIRIALVSVFYTYAYIVVARIVFMARPLARPHYAYWFVSIGACLGMIGHMGRGLAYGIGWVRQAELLQSTPVNIAFLALGVLALPWLSIGMVLLTHDRLAHRLERLANLDELTGILARRAFLAQAEAAARTASRSGRPLVLAIIDIDHFKNINDTYGHAAGDRVLAHFTGVVAGNLRAGDGFGRLGGEEFAVLCPDTSLPAAVKMLDRLRARVAQAESALPGRKLKVTFSAGVDQYRSGEPLTSLMARADAALYSAKAMGRDRVVTVAADDPLPVEQSPGMAD